MRLSDSLELVAFASVECPEGYDLPPEDIGKVLVSLKETGAGIKLTALVTEYDAEILKQGMIHLGGGFAAAGSFFKKMRFDWPEDWQNTSDTTQWVAPEVGL